MRPIGKKLMGIIGLMVTLSIFIGCGTSDLLDEPTTRNSASASPQNNNANTQEIDVVQSATACDGEPEEFFPFSLQLIVETDENSALFRIESYSVRFRPNHGAFEGAGASWEDVPAAGMPDLITSEINPVTYQYRSILIKPNTSTTLSGLLIWNQGDKRVYQAEIIAANALFDDSLFTYDMQAVLNCITEENVTFTITTPWTPVTFGDFDGCGSS